MYIRYISSKNIKWAMMMKSNIIYLSTFCLGMILMIFSWVISYPLSILSVDDYIFNNVSIFYWFSIPLLLFSIYMLSLNTYKNNLRFFYSILFLLIIYSLNFFYYYIPGSDSHYFRGNTEYLFNNNLNNPLNMDLHYLEWPLFFMLSYIFVTITSLEIRIYEFIIYSIIGLIITTCIYKYAINHNLKNGFLAVASYFFTIGFKFLNYQAVPFSFAFSILLIILLIDKSIKNSINKYIFTLILFICISYSHVYTPIFFILYEITKNIISKNRENIKSIILLIIIYSSVQILKAPISFNNIIMVFARRAVRFSYQSIIQETLRSSMTLIETISQRISFSITLITGLVTLIGFILMQQRKKISIEDKSILIIGIVYLSAGTFIQLLGHRMIALLFLPISLGFSYLFETKYKSSLIMLSLFLMIFFVSIPIYKSFYDAEIQFQTKEAYYSENFMVDKYSWPYSGNVLSHFRVRNYFRTKPHGYTRLESENDINFPIDIRSYNCIFYTVGLGKSFIRLNYNIEEIFHQNENVSNLVFNSGKSFIIICRI